MIENKKLDEEVIGNKRFNKEVIENRIEEKNVKEIVIKIQYFKNDKCE